MNWLAPCALFLAALAMRASVWPTVLVDGQVLVVSNDAYYHLRRILYASANFPQSIGLDPFLNFPEGARAIWPPFLDLVIAGVVRALSAGSPEDVERIAIWVPPVLGSAAVVAVYFVVRRWFGVAGGVLAGLALCLTPVHTWYAQLSFVDHHVAVALVAVALLAVALALATELAAAANPRRERNLGLTAGILVSLGLHVWTGFLMHHAVLLLPGLLALAVTAHQERARRLAVALAWAHVPPLLLVAPFGIGREWTQSEIASFTPIAFSNFHPWFFGTLVAFFAAIALAWRGALGTTRARRVLSAGGLGVLALAGALPLVGAVGGGVTDSLGFLIKAQPSMGQVAESVTILRFGGRSDPQLGPALRFASGLFVLGPLCAAFLLFSAADAASRARAGLILWCCLAWTASALLQARLANSLSVMNVVAFGGAMQIIWDRLRGERRHVARAALIAGGLAAALLPSLPLVRSAFARPLRVLSGEEIRLDRRQKLQRLVRKTGTWMRENTPEVRGFLDNTQRPEYGFLSSANLGHQLLWSSRRPALLGAFADYASPDTYARVQSLPTMREAELIAFLDEKRARYLVMGPSVPGGAPDTMRRLLRDDPRPARAARTSRAPFLEHLRLIYLSDPLGSDRPGELPYLRVYERVAGARVQGRAPAGTTVRFRLQLQDPLRGGWRHAAQVEADATGRYDLTLPYPSEVASGALMPSGPYDVDCAAGAQRLSVSERQVLRGEQLAGPDCSGGVVRGSVQPDGAS